ncbi:PREDICTED: uncharacterized protein LOC106805389 [Priapulus caudatus]|uniref:Uncharacterized protein LOC106805389 n=1 Tax=Priapulus caudatus TaxID=37621 RepID=A0ABM1DR68_PRICU|nr:PREDICTED: uncharacterized protein LOC106805389 [Priapulus caudatus]
MEQNAANQPSQLTDVVKVRRAEENELHLIIEWWLQDYSYCTCDHESLKMMHRFAGNGSLCAYQRETGQPIGFLMVANLNEDVAMAGWFIVKDAWRGKRVGQLLVENLRTHCGANRNLAINAVPQNVKLYEKLGLKVDETWENLKYVGLPVIRNLQPLPEDDIVIVDKNSMTPNISRALFDYDKKIHAGIQRTEIVNDFICYRNSIVFVATCGDVDDVIVVGYIIIMPTAVLDQYGVFPLYGNTPAIIQRLFCRAVEALHERKEKASLILAVPSANTAAVKMVEAAGLCNESLERRMYSSEFIPLDVSKIASVLTDDVTLW